MKKIGLSLLLLSTVVAAMIFAVPLPSYAAPSQEGTTPTPGGSTPLEVVIKVEDGLEIQGTYYPTEGTEKMPAILLLHQNGGRRQQWDRVVPALIGAGYNVLAVDQRGFGQTGGKRDYLLLEKDGVTLMNWLREQPTVDPDRVAVMGASVGANAAIRTCVLDQRCLVAIALSPGVNFFGVKPVEAIKESKGKSYLLLSGQNDSESTAAVKSALMETPRSSNALARLYADKGLHGTDLLMLPDVGPLILNWLELYNHKP